MNTSDYYQYLLALESRKILSKDERNNLLTYYNGKEGERYFKSFLNTIPNVTIFITSNSVINIMSKLII